jgi:hypothetical protein
MSETEKDVPCLLEMKLGERWLRLDDDDDGGGFHLLILALFL